MGSFHWLVENWFTLLNAVGVIGGLFFTGFSLRSETKTRQISNLITLTKNHREIWAELLRNPKLARVLNAAPNRVKPSVSCEEEVFVSLVIQHLNSVYRAMGDDLAIKPEKLRQDVGWFFALPIPQAVWVKLKVLQDDDFVKFVEACRERR